TMSLKKYIPKKMSSDLSALQVDSQQMQRIYQPSHTQRKPSEICLIILSRRSTIAELHPKRAQANSQRPLNLHTMGRAKSWESRREQMKSLDQIMLKKLLRSRHKTALVV